MDEVTAEIAYATIADGHAGYTVDHANAVARFFGVGEPPIAGYQHRAEPSLLKGWAGPDGVFVDGVDLAETIADRLGVDYYRFFNGRGKRAQAATEAIRNSRND